MRKMGYNFVAIVLSLSFSVLFLQAESDKSRDLGGDVDKLRQKLFGGSSGSRTINGENAKVAEFPWHISYRSRAYNNVTNTMYSYHVCGATLLNTTHFVTAAHCAQPSHVGTFYAEIGAWRILNGNETSQRIEIKRVTNHPFYDPYYFTGDISVVELAHPAVLNDRVQTLRLAPPNANPAGQLCTAIGWGRTLLNTSVSYYGVADILQKVQLKVITTEECRPRVQYVVTDGMMCLASPDGTHKGICQGDSGGSLICYDKDGPYFAGVSSWSNPKDCGNPKEAMGFTRVTDFLDFINNNISVKIKLPDYITANDTSVPEEPKGNKNLSKPVESPEKAVTERVEKEKPLQIPVPTDTLVAEKKSEKVNEAKGSQTVEIINSIMNALGKG